jgi:hypothetical protein
VYDYTARAWLSVAGLIGIPQLVSHSGRRHMPLQGGYTDNALT